MKRLVLATALILPLLAVAAHLPDRALNPELAAPVQTWDEAIPLGNGTMGVLLWGETNRLRLSLDRGDLWDERPAKHHVQTRDRFNWRSMQQLVASNRMTEFHDVFDANLPRPLFLRRRFAPGRAADSAARRVDR